MASGVVVKAGPRRDMKTPGGAKPPGEDPSLDEKPRIRRARWRQRRRKRHTW